jgi:DNA-binding GntR family transcriptional regulator
LDALARIPPDPRGKQLVRALRETIISGSLRPGDRIVERDISARTGVSRGPVREALLRLEQEGLVVSQPYRGAEVLGVSQEEVEEVLVPIRVVIERSAFRHALPLLSEADFGELRRLVEAMEDAAETFDLRKIVEADVRFHEAVIAKSGLPHCEQIWQAIVPRVRAYFYGDAPHHDHLGVIADEHRRLLRALEAKDEDELLPEVERHVRERPSFGGYGRGTKG